MLARNMSPLAVLAAVMLALPAARAHVSDDVVEIGVLTDMNGPASRRPGQGSVQLLKWQSTISAAGAGQADPA
jgi:branched-chain amino acid transport system substrate-binding protein